MQILLESIAIKINQIKNKLLKQQKAIKVKDKLILFN